MLVVVVEIRVNGGRKRGDALEGAAPQASGRDRDRGEEALHLIQPTLAGRGEVQVIAGSRRNQRITFGALWVPQLSMMMCKSWCGGNCA